MLSKRHQYLLLGGSSLLVVALIAGAAAVSQHADPVTVPEQTAIHVTLDQALASNQSRPGDHFEATVSEPIVIDEKTVIPEGAHAEGLSGRRTAIGKAEGTSAFAVGTGNCGDQRQDIRIAH